MLELTLVCYTVYICLELSANADLHSLVLNDKAFTSDEKLSSEKKEDDEFNEGQIDMKHYKSIVSWVVLDECADEESQGIKA